MGVESVNACEEHTTTLVSPWWLYGFVISQMILQTGLLIPGLGFGRTMLRAATFGTSILLLAILPVRGKRFPLAPLGILILGIMFLGLLHPGLNTPTAGVAQVGLYAAIWAPMLWVMRIAVTPRVFANLILLWWGFNSLSAALGVLQVYDPGRFAPDPEFVKQMAGVMAEGLQIDLNDGTRVFRPFGLTDSPGGAAGSGSFAALVGLLLVGVRGWVPRLLGGCSVAIGLFCIYLSYTRATLIVTLIGIVGLIGSLVLRGQIGRASGVIGVAVVAVLGAFSWAATVGTGVTDRFNTLFEDSPGKVYQSNRGYFLEETLTHEIPRYPLGAGLGRYGMMYAYFGVSTNANSPPLWAEIQPTAWVLDGGILLLLLGYASVLGAIGLATRFVFRLRNNSLASLAAVVAGYNVAILVNTAGYCNFLSQGGMMFWVINTALYAACKEAETR